mgnify:CR=1
MIRKNRWDLRETLKEKSNKYGQKGAMHPQVRKQIHKLESQVTIEDMSYLSCSQKGVK